MKTRFAYMPAILLVVLLVGFIFLFVRSVLRASEMEKNLHALLCTRNALQSFVANRNSWPLNWEELADLAGHQYGSMYRLPRDLNEVQSRVVLRFDVSRTDLSHPRDAELLTSHEPRYDYEWRLEPLFLQLEEAFAGPVP